MFVAPLLCGVFCKILNSMNSIMVHVGNSLFMHG